ncbi:hypothetical protein D3C87_253800 [compost metagenome]
MMKLANIAFVFVTLATSSISMATVDWQKNAVLVTLDSEMQAQIDELTIEIFNSPLQKTLCSVFVNPLSATYSLGISPEAAVDIYKRCPHSKDDSSVAKFLRKQFYISFQPQAGLESWTDHGNRTFIFADKSLNRERLKSILVHELAIAMDAKMNMNFSTYALYSATSTTRSSGGFASTTFDMNAEEQVGLRAAFNFSSWRPIAMAFATLRAFNFEMLLHGNDFPTDNHATCVREFKSLLRVTKNLPEVSNSQGPESVFEQLAEAASKHQTPKSAAHEAQVIDFLLDPNLRIADHQKNKMTFCQFMTRPLLTGSLTFSNLGNGPRPRLTGGSGGQGYGSQMAELEQQMASKNLEKRMIDIDNVQNALSKMKRLPEPIIIPKRKCPKGSCGK